MEEAERLVREDAAAPFGTDLLWIHAVHGVNSAPLPPPPAPPLARCETAARCPGWWRRRG
jgi:hypothetical protein